MSSSSPSLRQRDCVLLSSSRCIKPCCEAEIKLKIISRAIRRKSSIEQLTHLLDCLVETKNGHGETLTSGYHARLWLARDEGKVEERVNKKKPKPKVKKERKKESKIGIPNRSNSGSQWTWKPPALEVPNLETAVPAPPTKDTTKESAPAKGATKINGHKDKQEPKDSLKDIAAQEAVVPKPAESESSKKRSAENENKTPSRPKKKARMENGSEESKSNKGKRPAVFVFCQHCKKIRHLAPRSDKKSSKDIFRHECRNELGQPVRVSQNLLTRSRNCKIEHAAGCIRLATLKEISDLQQKKRASSTTNEVDTVPEGEMKKEPGALPI